MGGTRVETRGLRLALRLAGTTKRLVMAGVRPGIPDTIKTGVFESGWPPPALLRIARSERLFRQTHGGK